MFYNYIIKIILLFLFNNFLISNTFDLNKINDYSKNFKHVNDLKVINTTIDNSSYLLGAGDRIAINFLANDIFFNNILTVSPSNDLLIPNIGMINVEGMTVDAFIDSLNALCKKKFDIFELNITLTDLRMFNVMITGFNNSSYYYSVNHATRVCDLLNSIKKINSDLFNYISDRNITFKRNSISYNVDLLKHNSFENTYNPFLLENDVIILNKKERFYEIVGEIKNPGFYEYIEFVTLNDIINLSGGLLFSADSSSITIFRDNNNRINIDSKDFNNYEILSNDYIVVNKNKSIKNLEYTYIYGSVYNPGKYPVFDSTTVRDIIGFAEGYNLYADTNKIFINNDIIKKNIDIEFLRINNILPHNRSASEISYYKSRLMLDRGTSRSFESFPTKNILDSKVKADDFIYIPSRTSSIEILGAVSSPGNYSYNKNYSLEDYIEISGSLTNLSSGNYFLINTSGEKKQIDSKFTDFKSGDILFIEQKADINRWIKFKEIMSVLGQIATILVVVRN